jgi:hypothetical protein
VPNGIVINGANDGILLVDVSDAREPVLKSSIPTAYDAILVELKYSPGINLGGGIRLPISSVIVHLGPKGTMDVSNFNLPFNRFTAFQDISAARGRTGPRMPDYDFGIEPEKKAPDISPVGQFQPNSRLGFSHINLDPLQFDIKGQAAYRFKVNPKTNTIDIEGLNGRAGGKIESNGPTFLFNRLHAVGPLLYVSGFNTERSRDGTYLGALGVRVYRVAQPPEVEELGEVRIGEVTPLRKVSPEEGVMAPIGKSGILVNAGPRGFAVIDVTQPDDPFVASTILSPSIAGPVVEEFDGIFRGKGPNFMKKMPQVRLHLGGAGVWDVSESLAEPRLLIGSRVRLGMSYSGEIPPHVFPQDSLAEPVPIPEAKAGFGISSVRIRGEMEPDFRPLTILEKGAPAYRVAIAITRIPTRSTGLTA